LALGIEKTSVASKKQARKKGPAKVTVYLGGEKKKRKGRGRSLSDKKKGSEKKKLQKEERDVTGREKDMTDSWKTRTKIQKNPPIKGQVISDRGRKEVCRWHEKHRKTIVTKKEAKVLAPKKKKSVPKFARRRGLQEERRHAKDHRAAAGKKGERGKEPDQRLLQSRWKRKGSKKS